MAKGKRVMAHFNEAINNIIFYNVEDYNKKYILLRKQGTKEYLIYNTKNNTYAKVGKFEAWHKIDTKLLTWNYSKVFFWVNSPFVTKFGTYGYNTLVKTYKQLLKLKEIKIKNKIRYKELMKALPFFKKIKVFFYYNLNVIEQERTLRKQIKRLKVIW